VDAVIGMQRERCYRMQPAGERVRVRMGISSGEASQTAAARPGLLRYRLIANAGLKDLGLRCMNGMGRPERIFQLQAEGIAAAFRGGRAVNRRC
jgi:hypothetical protein